MDIAVSLVLLHQRILLQTSHSLLLFSARNKQLGWFIVFLIVSTVGILEIIYLIFFKKGSAKQ